ncbi:MAG: ribose-phosphate diphosphokinase, partial [Clostridia bacterium]|nr:ribose-phosphate diphosphokinase [Clostridia bacterium]
IGGPTLQDYFKSRITSDFVIISPDIGSVARARKVAGRMNASLAIIDKRRPKANVMEVMNIIGEVEGKSCLMVDDLIDTAGTITQGAQALVDAGAKEVFACCTHGVLSGAAIERLDKSPITELAMLDTINIPEEKILPKFHIISTAKIFASAIENIYLDRPMTKVYDS